MKSLKHDVAVPGFQFGLFIDILEIRKSAFENVDVGVKAASDSFQDNDVGEESGKLSIQFHFVLSDNPHHIPEEDHPFELAVGGAVQSVEALGQLLVVVAEFIIF